MRTRGVDGRKVGAVLQLLLLAFLPLAVGALFAAKPRDAETCEVRTRRLDWNKLSAGLQRLLLVFVLLALGALASGSTGAGEAALLEPPDPRPAMSIEVPPPGEVTLPFRIAGWAVDLAAREGTGVDQVEVLKGGCQGAVIAIATYGIDRPDVGDSFGLQFAPSGWHFVVETMSPGRHLLAARMRSTVAGEFNDCRSVYVDVK